MASEEKNQSNIINSELNLKYNKYIFADKPINRFQTKPKVEDISTKLDELRNEIEKIENCELKKNASKIVFSDGNNESKIMIVGEGPGQREDQEGKPFKGVLYTGVMLTDNGPKVIEFNVRLGDPEAQVILPRLKSDFLTAILATIDGGLKHLNLRWHEEIALNVVLTSSGYPANFIKGKRITCLLYTSPSPRD